ncbi:A/G-specific adenine glycosylase [Candidatus Enterovibrio escicola]|uniref:A/G-specific adenine glycosylase n=4 Tax=Candidatus Enterovibrio escicola TaxID=1927127 RepID=A0A2A5T339_9GAMM|nr:A/G-specific adenine glycosylase [Candidatus Enterovibrio escacola]
MVPFLLRIYNVLRYCLLVLVMLLLTLTPLPLKVTLFMKTRPYLKMRRLLTMKRLLYILIVFILLVLIAISVFVAVINPNDFKPLIAEKIKESIGRELVIDGDINWSFWPNLGFSVENLALKNPKGFARSDLISLNKAEMSVSVMPLLSNTLDIGVISLYGAYVFIQTLPNGKSNLDNLISCSVLCSGVTAESASTSVNTSTPVSKDSTALSNLWTVSIAGLDLIDASASIRNDKVGKVNEISKLNLKVGKLAAGLWVPIEFNIEGKQDYRVFTVRSSLDVMLTADTMNYQFRQLSLFVAMKDSKFELESFILNANRLSLALPATISLSAKGKVNDLNFTTSGTTQFMVDKSMVNISLSDFNLSSVLSNSVSLGSDINVDLKSAVDFDVIAKKLSFSKLLATIDEVTVEGNASVVLAQIPDIRFALHSKHIDFNVFSKLINMKLSSNVAAFVPSFKNSQEDNKTEKKVPINDIEPDLSAFYGLDITGNITFGHVIIGNIKVSDVDLTFMVNRGKVNLRQFNAKLYGGTVSSKGTLDLTVSPAKYQLTKEIKNVNIQPLMMDLVQKNILSGIGNIHVNLSGIGLSEQRLRSGITGTFTINFVNGGIDGINFSKIIRDGEKILKGKHGFHTGETKKIDFNALTATVNFVNGNASTYNLNFEGPAMRIRSSGVTNLLTATLQFKVFAYVMGTKKEQGDKNIMIPFSIGGTWQVPTYDFDVKKFVFFNKILEQKVRKEAERGLMKFFNYKSDNNEVKKVGD